MTKNQHPAINLKWNLILYYVSVGIILLGYVFLSIGGADSFTSITLGPVVMVFGYLVAVPYALLTGTFHGKNEKNGDHS